MKSPMRRSGLLYKLRSLLSLGSQMDLILQASPACKAAQRALYVSYRNMAVKGEPLPSIWDTGFRVFSQFDEDGIILFLLGIVGSGPRKFVDIGAGDGFSGSNCANLAINFGFHGLFVDGDPARVASGQRFYGGHPDTHLYPPRFVHAFVNRDNVNQVIRGAGFEGEVDLLSIDLDGNDYWIWDAIECINPRIVVIETHVEFGTRSIVVPYDETYIFPGVHPDYHGASPVAMAKLARKLGYRLVGANRFGFNSFYLRQDLGQGLIPEIEPADVLRHDRNKDRMARFEEIKDFRYEVV